MEHFNLNQTINTLTGPPVELIKVNNYWAATALDRYHKNSKAEFEYIIHGESKKAIISWDSNFSKVAMKEDKDIANFGGVSMAWFIMSVLLNFRYVEQSEIGEGVDYRFMKTEPADEDLNFLDNFHFVEISGILEESKTNTITKRIKEKHNQIKKGSRRNEESSVIVTLFSKPLIVKEIHK